MTLKRAWHSILAAVDGQIEREIDKSIADKPIPLPREVPMPLMGADPAKMLANTEMARDKAEIRKQAIEAEISRLTGELHNTILSMDAASAAIKVLRDALDSLPTTMPDAELEKELADFSATVDLRGHTSSERRLEEYAASIHPDQTSPMTVERERHEL